MDRPELLRLGQVTASEIGRRFPLPQEAQRWLRDDMGAREFVETLLANRLYVAGIDFMAHALPTCEAVWWGCLCVQHASGKLSSADAAAGRAAARWVLEPSEENRLAAREPAEAAGPSSLAGRLAMAAYQTDVGCAGPGAPPVRPAPFAAAKSVAEAVKMACTQAEPAKIAETQRLFVELAIAVAEGRFRWPEVTR